MPRRSNKTEVSTIDVQGVLGAFKVPNSNLTVEYILTYASLDGGDTPNGQLLDLLVPVREVFNIEDLDFDHLLQRDLDDYRVSEKMVPYLLGETLSEETTFSPRFFPPILAIIVPMNGNNMDELYPECILDKDEDQGVPLKVFKYGNVFSVKREMKEDNQLAQSPTDLCIHPTQAKLVIVDGQHRAMAVLAAYRSASSNKWSGNGSEFQYFYKERNLDMFVLHQIHLPVCIAYFPELTTGVENKAERNLTVACRRLFLDVNRNARQPSKAREILLDDTDLVACFTRHLFNMVKKNSATDMLKLYHTEYDNPHDKVPTTRPFALTNVFTIFDIIRFVLLSSDNSILDPMTRYYSGRPAVNNQRLRRELDLDNVLTEEDKEVLGVGISNIEQYNYPRHGEKKFRQCFEDGWGQVIMNSLSKFYPYSKHIEAVDSILEISGPYFGENKIAHTALVQGQGLRHTLSEKQQNDNSDSSSKENGEKSDVQRAWEVLRAMEEKAKIHRAKLYLEISSDPTDEQIRRVNSIYDCFCSNAFQTGLFMAFAYLRAKIGIEDRHEFIQTVDKWISYINERFQNSEGIRSVMFNHLDPSSLRSVFKPRGGLIPSDGYFCRYLILEILSSYGNDEAGSIETAQRKWRQKLYRIRYAYKEKIEPLPLDESEKANFQKDLDERTFKDIVDAFKNSLNIDEDDIKKDLESVRQGIFQSVLENEDIDDEEDG